MSSPPATAGSDPLATVTPNHWSNLLWALEAPDIAPDFPLPWLPVHRHRALTEFFSRPDVHSQLAPALLAHLERLRHHRLGIYFESLWAFAFTHHPDYELLAHNFPIRDQGKTLGELDFVVRHNPDNTHEHWEIALKFYLQLGDYWVGPGLRDRLDIKLARMRNHQLPIARSAIATDTLQASGLTIDRQWARMPGRLFSPLAGPDLPQPGALWWTDLAGFDAHLSAHQNNWRQLPKPCWLSPIQPDSSTTAFPVAHAHLARGPICVAAHDGQSEVSRGFLVPSDWLSRARDTVHQN
ncbi:DUF1853 family protein [Microbulbifer elongatus]|uniref:DUF1853 family protein n=1 Tax=Microbulbifer elongatus TaxID=86173 RepID=A0ABT1NXC8_9GAMM|nr:DUF1853 family protein [Microbulbifer elongatus]MCQ3828513.1 DUF1853 family protein [Microbulbifer elongatus]